MVCRPRCMFMLLVLTCVLSVPGLVLAETLRVDGTGKTGFATIQEAIDTAADGDVIMIEPGTYSGRGNQDINLQRKAIRVQGTDPEDAAVVEATVIDCGATESDPHRGFYVNNFTGKIAGLTITNGLASAGGAIYCENSALVLEKCHIVDNATLAGTDKGEADGGPGAGIYCEASTLEIVDCLISGNVTGDGADSRDSSGGAGGDGAGVYSVGSVLYVSGSTITENVTGMGGDSEIIAGRGGNGAGIHGDSLVVTDSQITNNVCGHGGASTQGGQGGEGAGIYGSRVTVATTVIEGNQAGTGGDSNLGAKGLGGLGGHGGGILCVDSLDVRSSLIVGNRAGLAGGESNSTVAALGGRGGGISCSYGVIDHCTIVGNAAFGDMVDEKASALGSGGGVACVPQTAITNSIIWGNTVDQIAGQDCTNVLYCDIANDTCSESRSNISVDPLFAEAGYWADPRDTETAGRADDPDATWVSGDYHLSDESPCIDAADPEHKYASDETDLDGRIRVADIAADMGAYESQNLVPVYRFQSRRTEKFLYTAKESEKDKLINREADAWEYEGIAYYVYKTQVVPELTPVYRFWSAKSSTHLFTISESEKDRLIDNYPTEVWEFEGIAFYAYPAGSQPEGAKPVYRFYSARLGGHFFTIDEDEADQYRADTATWTAEGVAWYAFDEPYAAEEPETPSPSEPASLYDLTAGSDAATYTVELKAYVDGVEALLDNATIEFTPAMGRMEMALDLDAMTAQMTEFHLETEFVEHTATVTLADPAGFAFPVDLSLTGFFDAMALRGPYVIESKGVSFPATSGTEAASDQDTIRIVGSAVADGGKFDVNLTLNATQVILDGAAAIDDSGYPDRLDVSMDGPWQWNRRQQDLLLETTIKGHTLELYAEAVQVRPMGFWRGKSVAQAQEDHK